MSFNTTENVTSVTQLVQYSNDVSDGWFGYFMIITVWVIAFAISALYRTEHAITAASFVTFIVAALLAVAGIVGTGEVILPLAMMFVGYVISKVS